MENYKAFLSLETPIQADHQKSTAETLAKEIATNSSSYSEAYAMLNEHQKVVRSKEVVLEKAKWYLKDFAFHQFSDQRPQVPKIHTF